MPVSNKGAVRNILSSLDTFPLILTIYEIIDDRAHSKSKKVFIDFDLHGKCCCVGYSEKASKKDLDNVTRWYNVNENQNKIDNIASKGIGLKTFQFKTLGRWVHYTFSDNDDYYHVSEVNTAEIYTALSDDYASEDEFTNILMNSTSRVKDEDEIIESINKIFNNKKNQYPFNPKTLFINQKLSNLKLLDEFKDENGNFDFEDVIKKLKIKYFHEISEGLELYIKFPLYSEFKQITNDNIDVIGFTSNKIDILETHIFIDKDIPNRYKFKIKDKIYIIGKNGNSSIRKNVTEKYKCELNDPDYTLIQYNINNMTKEEKKNSIIGNSEEPYAGVYIQIGGTFINDFPVESNFTTRNLHGSKNYRAVLKVNTTEGKSHLQINGLKAQFNLRNMVDLHSFIKNLTDVYKIYIKNGKPDNPSHFVENKKKISKSNDGFDKKEKDGYFYIIRLSTKHNFYKLGIGMQTRIYDHGSENSSLRREFSDEIDFDAVPHGVYVPLTRFNNIRLFEETIKAHINDSILCSTLNCEKGTDIREEFYCNDINELLKEIACLEKTHRDRATN